MEQKRAIPNSNNAILWSELFTLHTDAEAGSCEQGVPTMASPNVSIPAEAGIVFDDATHISNTAGTLSGDRFAHGRDAGHENFAPLWG